MATNNLPWQLTPLIGRADELRQISRLLANPDCRLLTLLGPGGIGKSRLAIEAAKQRSAAFVDGVYFLRLQSVQSANLITTAIADAMGFAIHEPHDQQRQLHDYMRDRATMLILDNMEHLLEGAAQIKSLLDAAPKLKLIATSREVLNLSEEWLYSVGGLAYPRRDSAEDLEGYGAVQMFADCARRQRPDFSVHEQVGAIINLCRMVGGVPLALELAASWVRTLSVAAITEQIQQGIDFLTTTRRDMPARHRNMRAVFDSSWQMLSDEEQAVFRSLSVFRGGFTADAAMSVADASLQILAALIDKSFVQSNANDRYELHELSRQYACEQLDQLPELREDILDKHCTYFSHLMHRHEATFHLGKQSEVLADLDNIRAAWRRAVQCRNLTALQQATPALHWLYHFQCWHDEGVAMFCLAEEALISSSMMDNTRFLLGMIQLLRWFFRPEQLGQMQYRSVDIEAALALWEGLEARPEMCLPLTRAALRLRYNLSDPRQVIAVARRGLDVSRRYHDLSNAAISLTALADVNFTALGKFAEAKELLEEAKSIDRQIGFDLNARWVAAIQGRIASLEGRYAEASVYFETSVMHHHRGGITRGLDTQLCALGIAVLERGNVDDARSHLEEGIALASHLKRSWGVATGLAGLGIAAAFEADMSSASAHFEASHACLRDAGIDPSSDPDPIENLGLLSLLLGYHAHALAHYRTIQSHFKDKGYRVPLMCANSRAGHALLGLGDELQAKSCLFDALQEAAAIGAFQIALEALAGIAQLSVIPPLLTIELMMLIRDHPASNRYSRTLAEQKMLKISLPLLEAEVATALERGKTLTLAAALVLVKTLAVDRDTPQVLANQRLVEALSQRELQVLASIAGGCTNQEIADLLRVGVSTVKKHINHIYGKLDVTSRTQAVARARSLDLLS